MTTPSERNARRWQALQSPQLGSNGSRPAAEHRAGGYRMATRTDEGNRTASIDLYGSIGGFWGGVNARQFVTDLRDLDVDEITVHINSPGGDVFDGIAIMNALRQHTARVVTVVDGLAASAASFIAVGAGDEVVMGRNAELMVHDAWGFAIGNAGDMRQMADELDRVSNNIARVYADRTGGERDDWRQIMVEETWYDDEEAVTAGLADRVLGRDEVDDADEHVSSEDDTEQDDELFDRFDLSVFAHAGRSNAPTPRMPRRPHTPAASASGSRTTSTQEGGDPVDHAEFLNALRQKFGAASDADEATILAAADEALAERADPQNRPDVPEGMSLVDSSALADLQAAAQDGRDARAQQTTERRERLVDAALREGKFGFSARDGWLQRLQLDPVAGERDLANLAPGLVPVTELGHGSDDARNETDDVYAALFGAASSQEG